MSWSRLEPSPLTITPAETPGLDGVRVLRAEHGWIVETTGELLSVRRRLQQEILVPRETRFLLEEGDVLWSRGAGAVLRTEPVHREPSVERVAVDDWGQTGAWGVLSDRLLDHGDPLGERMTASLGLRASTPLAPHTWIGAAWRHGVLQRLSLSRPEWASQVPWRQALLEILVSRPARFLDELAIDLPRLEPEASATELLELGRELLTLPLPTWLSRLHFGALPNAPALLIPEPVLQRHPRLSRTPLFRAGERARLVLESASDLITVDGLEHDRLELTESLRVRVFPTRVLFERPQWPRYDSWPSWDFALHEGRWFITWRHGAPRSDELRVNGMEFFNAALVPGDRLEIMQRVVLRFEVDG